MKNFLGIDWGTSFVGLALADNETRIAFSYDTLKNDGEFFKKLADLIERESVDTIVLGMPVIRTQQESFDIKEIGGKIKEELGVNISYQNEMFTTKIAEKNLIERGMKKIKRLDNQESARIILQDWLDSE
ncbi:Holliday junction resolvase RuvX [Patescibacteria group bacterium]